MRAARARAAAGAAAILAALACAAAPLAAPAPAQEPASLPDIEDEVMCPICGTLLELSESPQAERERNLIRRLIDEGRTKDEIKDALVAEYGSEVLATPEDSGFDLAAWVLPALAFALAGVGIGVALVRTSRRADPDAQPQEAMARADAERLDRELESYDG